LARADHVQNHWDIAAVDRGRAARLRQTVAGELGRMCLRDDYETDSDGMAHVCGTWEGEYLAFGELVCPAVSEEVHENQTPDIDQADTSPAIVSEVVLRLLRGRARLKWRSQS
jgi:hypothetical protein